MKTWATVIRASGVRKGFRLLILRNCMNDDHDDWHDMFFHVHGLVEHNTKMSDKLTGWDRGITHSNGHVSNGGDVMR